MSDLPAHPSAPRVAYTLSGTGPVLTEKPCILGNTWNSMYRYVSNLLRYLALVHDLGGNAALRHSNYHVFWEVRKECARLEQVGTHVREQHSCVTEIRSLSQVRQHVHAAVGDIVRRMVKDKYGKCDQASAPTGRYTVQGESE